MATADDTTPVVAAVENAPISLPMTVTTCDGFRVENAGTLEKFSATIQDLRTMTGSDDVVHLPQASWAIIKRLITWCNHAAANPRPVVAEADKYRTDNMTQYDIAFLSLDKSSPAALERSMHELFGMMVAANWLAIEPLTSLTCKAVANIIKGSSPEEVRTQFLLDEEFVRNPIQYGVRYADTTSPEFVDQAALDRARTEHVIQIAPADAAPEAAAVSAAH